MEVTIRYFAGLREAAGGSERRLEVAEGGTVGQVREELLRQHPSLAELLGSAAVAVNRRIAAPSQRLEEGDEVAFLPPVSGG